MAKQFKNQSAKTNRKNTEWAETSEFNLLGFWVAVWWDVIREKNDNIFDEKTDEKKKKVKMFEI